MDNTIDQLDKQIVDDVFDAFTMLSKRNGFISVMHVEKQFSRYSKNAVEMLGIPDEYLLNNVFNWQESIHPDDRNRYMTAMIPLLEGESRTYDITYRLKLKNGDYCNFRNVGAVIRGKNGKPLIIGGYSTNDGLSLNIDPITLISNKESYILSLSKLISEKKYSISLMIGINKLKEINKIRGYNYGNKLLQEIAWTLQELTINRANVYKAEGPCFVILSEKLTNDEIHALYDMIRYKLQRGLEVWDK